ncbi:GNAT family N-acetyltransferase [Halorubrum vacuolatum]|uniref:Acetyltransferase (GNAT) family protein n=1 Tax=Halorubrum vacuolatum TaxID=63740 RepID=A0A238UTP6_HALVU|nr:GNAT family N-acetyltransferase [Halorubrum vacuolatum]SNR25418.1 Acetyltransferase (GNAT) family protein [Halorubrum vacuolatum]
MDTSDGAGPVTITELTDEDAIRACHPLMAQLRPVDEATFMTLIDRMRRGEGYRLFRMEDAAGDPVALAGLVVTTNLYHGKHTWVHDLVVDEPRRGSGYGGRFLEWIADWADERDCSCVELASGLWRENAHRFYEANDMERYCYTFKRDLDTPSPY